MLMYAIGKLAEGKDLTEEEAMNAMRIIMEGNATPAQIGSYITALRMKGETLEEITGCARAMREKAYSIQPHVPYCIDTCGTGGDGTHSYNISTAAAFVAAAAGVPVVKHGNRSISSKCGSADVLEKLGIRIKLAPQQVAECVDHVGIGFLFAPVFHTAMKYAAGPRKELGIRTVFNVLGPLTNPASAGGQVLGVFGDQLLEPVAGVLKNLGVERALVVHGSDGMDEITVTDETHIAELRNGNITTYTITPEEFGMKRASRGALTGGDAETNAQIIQTIFHGERGPRRDALLLNAAAALYVGKAAGSLEQGIALAGEIIDSGKAMTKVKELSAYTRWLSDCDAAVTM